MCLLIALVLRLLVILNQTSQLTVDRDAYLGIATSVAEGRGYSNPNSTTPTAFRPPLYPLALAAGFYWFSTEFVVAIINLIAGMITVWITVSLGKHLQLELLRFVAALLVAVDPLLLQYTAQPMTESLCTLLATFWLWTVVAKPTADMSSKPADSTIDPAATNVSTSRFERHPVTGFVNGIAFGLLVLCRPTFWVIAGFCFLIWSYERQSFAGADDRSRMSSFLRGIWAVLGTFLTVAPWVIRNWLIFGVPILTTTHGGYTLLLGNNPVFYNEVVRQPWRTVWPDASQQEWYNSLEDQMAKELGPQASEVDRDAWQSRLAKTYIASEPRHFAESSLHRIRSLWNTTPQGDAGDGVNRLALIAVGWFYTVVLLSGFLGMLIVLRRGDRSQWLPFFILIVSVQLVHLAYWTNTRMRAPLTPAIALFAVAGIQRSRSAPIIR
jgi:hypothetical protein